MKSLNSLARAIGVLWHIVMLAVWSCVLFFLLRDVLRDASTARLIHDIFYICLVLFIKPWQKLVKKELEALFT